MFFIILILILLVILVISFIIAWKVTNMVINPARCDVKKALYDEAHKGYISLEHYNSLKKEDYTLTTADGCKLSCKWIYPEKPSKKVAVLCHGYSFNLVGSIKYADIFLNRGFNVVIYDHRNCGNSDINHTTMGYLEKNDLKEVVDYVYDKIGKDSFVGTHGESMGAATVLLHSCIDSRIKFVIADCPYENLNEELAYRLRIELKLPKFPVLYIASLISKIRAGFFFGNVSPIRDIKNKNGLPNLPIMFIHGKDDDYIPPSSSQNMYDIKRGPKMIYLADKAHHAQSICVDKIKYTSEVNKFLDSVSDFYNKDTI